MENAPAAPTLLDTLKSLKAGRIFKTLEIAHLVGLTSTHGLSIFVRPKGQGVIILLVTLTQKKGQENPQKAAVATWVNGILQLVANFTPGRQQRLIDQTETVFLFTRQIRPGDFTYQGQLKLLRGPSEPQKVAEFSFSVAS